MDQEHALESPAREVWHTLVQIETPRYCVSEFLLKDLAEHFLTLGAQSKWTRCANPASVRFCAESQRTPLPPRPGKGATPRYLGLRESCANPTNTCARQHTPPGCQSNSRVRALRPFRATTRSSCLDGQSHHNCSVRRRRECHRLRRGKPDISLNSSASTLCSD